MKIEDCFQLGYIVKPHGIQGAFTVYLDTDNPEHYKGIKSVYVEHQHKLIPFFVEHLHISGNRANLKFGDIDGIEAASAYKGCSLYLPLTMLPPLDDQQFYYHEIVGYAVQEASYGNLGVVSNVYEGHGNDLLAIKYKGSEVLVPLRDEFILGIDKRAKLISLDLPDGLIDIYLNP
jgi:16S rRNA processing protein RimM